MTGDHCSAQFVTAELRPRDRSNEQANIVAQWVLRMGSCWTDQPGRGTAGRGNGASSSSGLQRPASVIRTRTRYRVSTLRPNNATSGLGLVIRGN